MFEYLKVPSEWKRHSGDIVMPVALGKAASKQIESRSEIMDSIPELCFDVSGDGGGKFQLNDLLSTLRIEILSETAWASFGEPMDRAFHVADMGFGPFNL